MEQAPRLFRATASADETVAATLAAALEEAIAPEATAVGYTNESGDIWVVEAYYDFRPDPEILADLFRTAASRNGFPPPAVSVEPVEDRDWVRESQERLHPLEAGRFVLYGSHDRDRRSPGKINLEINAGLAFGSGHHATTLGCLLALNDVSRKVRPQRVFDLGCGSGILAIAAAKQTRRMVLASDIDPVATQTTKTNAVLNGVAPLIRAVTAPGLGHREIRALASFDLIFANILAGPLVELAPGLSRIVAPGGRVILSGLLNRQETRVFAAYRIQGFLIEKRIRIDGWSTLILNSLG